MNLACFEARVARGQEPRPIAANWQVVREWTEVSRYQMKMQADAEGSNGRLTTR